MLLHCKILNLGVDVHKEHKRWIWPGVKSEKSEPPRGKSKKISSVYILSTNRMRRLKISNQWNARNLQGWYISRESAARGGCVITSKWLQKVIQLCQSFKYSFWGLWSFFFILYPGYGRCGRKLNNSDEPALDTVAKYDMIVELANCFIKGYAWNVLYFYFPVLVGY